MKGTLLMVSVAFLATTVGLSVRLYQVSTQNARLREDISMVTAASISPNPCLADLAKVKNNPAFVSCNAGAFVVLRRY